MAIYRSSIEQFSKFSLFAKQVVQGFLTGLHKSPFHGFSIEFAEHRLYNQGESTRNIDWKLYGKTDKFFTKKYEEETNLKCHVLLDISDSMRFPPADNSSPENLNKLGFAVYSAAALLTLIQKQRDAFALHLIQNEIEFSSNCKNTGAHLAFLLDRLEIELQKVELQKRGTHLKSHLSELNRMLPPRSLVIVISDFLDAEDFSYALLQLKHQNHEVLALRVFDAKLEEQFEFEQEAIKLIDNESGEVIKLHPKTFRNDYIKAYQERVKSLTQVFRSLEIDLVDSDIRKGFEPVLQSYLSKRKRSRY